MRLEEKIKALEKQQVKAADVKISDKMINEIHKFREGAKNEKKGGSNEARNEEEAEPEKTLNES